MTPGWYFENLHPRSKSIIPYLARVDERHKYIVKFAEKQLNKTR